MTGLPCITNHQPYASLIFTDRPEWETRPKPVPPKLLGQRVGIHAGAKRPPFAAYDDSALVLMAMKVLGGLL